MDLKGADLSKHNPELLRKIKWVWSSAYNHDTLEFLLGPYWYNKLDLTRLREVCRGQRFTRTDEKIQEWGIVYQIHINKTGQFPVLQVWYNIFGGGHGARCVEWIEGRFDRDIDLREFLVFGK